MNISGFGASKINFNSHIKPITMDKSLIPDSFTTALMGKNYLQ